MSKNDAKKPVQRRSEQEIEDGWPNTIRTREELDAALEAGSKSGRSKLKIPDILKKVLRESGHG
jgi:hypothetical protein